MKYGVIVGTLDGRFNHNLADAVGALINQFRTSNPRLTEINGPQRPHAVGDNAAQSIMLVNESPSAASRDRLWIVMVQRPQDYIYIVSIAPEQEFGHFETTFQQIVQSLRFDR